MLVEVVSRLRGMLQNVQPIQKSRERDFLLQQGAVHQWKAQYVGDICSLVRNFPEFRMQVVVPFDSSLLSLDLTIRFRCAAVLMIFKKFEDLLSCRYLTDPSWTTAVCANDNNLVCLCRF